MPKPTDAIVVEGRNVDEALQAACDKLNTTPNQVEHEVVESGKSGMLGFLKGRTVKVRVWQKTAAQRMITEKVQGLFEHMGVSVETRVTQAEDAYEIEIETEDSDGLLIGRGGETLKALQHLISRMVGNQDETLRVRVDVAGYCKRRHEQLRRKARDLAERALSNNRDALTEPLPADERRIVHMELTDDARVETRAIGTGQVKRVAISVTGQRSGNGGDARGERGRGPRSAERSSRGRSQGSSTRRDSRDGRRAGGVRPPRGEERERDESRDRDRDRDQDRDRERSRPERPRQRRDEEAPVKERDPRPAEPVVERKSQEDKPFANSYFKIPSSMSESDREETAPEKSDSEPVTWGRKRRPGRGRR